MEMKQMGTVYTEITLKNRDDIAYAKIGHIKPEAIRTATVTAVADTGAMYPVITEELRQQLGLGIKEEKNAHIANGQRIKSYLTEPVEIIWKDRRADLNVLVIPGAEKILLGVLALEAMDLMVNPVTQEVVGVHGDREEFLAL